MLFRRGEGLSLPGNDGAIAAVLLGLRERFLGFGQPPESEKRPGSAERCVTETGPFGQDEVVLAQRLRGVVTHDRKSRKTNAIFERVGVGHEAGAVRMFRVNELLESETDDAERMPHARVPRCTPERLLEARTCELVFAPRRSA